jgi:hypothetical protein
VLLWGGTVGRLNKVQALLSRLAGLRLGGTPLLGLTLVQT